MYEEEFPAADKILVDIETVIKKDQKLLGFEVIPVSVNENKSPVVHSEHWLGLESWCVPHVYCHAYNRVMAYRQNKTKREDHNTINRLLMGVLMINPDVTTFWNIRKELMTCEKLDPRSELRFTALVLSRKPKCADIFAHRKWIIQRMFKDGCDGESELVNEMTVCELAADRYSNNYHAWTHRLWILQQALERTEQRRSKLLEQEWAWSERWITCHISDHSGLYYRQRLLSIFEMEGVPPSVGKRFPKGFPRWAPPPVRFLVSELFLISELMQDFPSHEALWSHRRFVLHSLQRLVGPLSPPPPDHGNELAQFLIAFEESFLHAASDHTRYMDRHRQWLNRVLKLQLQPQK